MKSVASMKHAFSHLFVTIILALLLTVLGMVAAQMQEPAPAVPLLDNVIHF